MPSKSPAQRRLMQAAAHNPEFAAKVGVPPTVAQEFVAADKNQATRLAQQLRSDAARSKR